MTTILISEVAQRDGLQAIDRVMPPAAKKAWIAAEAVAGALPSETLDGVTSDAGLPPGLESRAA